jgi:hypothetical protein
MLVCVCVDVVCVRGPNFKVARRSRHSARSSSKQMLDARIAITMPKPPHFIHSTDASLVRFEARFENVFRG